MSVQKTYSSEREIAEIWKLFRETSREMKEMSKETSRKMQEMSENTDRQMRATDRKLAKLEDLFTGQWEKLVETLVEGDLVKLLQERDIKVEATLTSLKGEYDGEYAEFDIIAVNGKEVVVVEVKTTLQLSQVKYFIKKLEKFTKWRPEYKNKKVYGAVAYLKANAGSDKYAKKQKLFVIKATGSSASITNSENFKPKVFS